MMTIIQILTPIQRINHQTRKSQTPRLIQRRRHHERYITCPRPSDDVGTARRDLDERVLVPRHHRRCMDNLV